MRHFDYFDFSYVGYGLLWMIGVTVLLVIPFWNICKKSGHSGVWSILIVVPIVNLIFLYWLAFSEWDDSDNRAAA